MQFHRFGSTVVATAVGLLATIASTQEANAQYRVECSSRNYQPQRCPLQGYASNIVLVQQLSTGRGRCIQNQTWGWDSYGLWVTNGCRAIFAVYQGGGGYPGGPGYPGGGGYPGHGPGGPGHGPGGPGGYPPGGGGYPPGGGGYPGGYGGVVTCSSEGYRYNRCYVNGYIRGVQMQRQLSNLMGQCIQGRTWGFDANSIWVDRGCRAEFRVFY